MIYFVCSNAGIATWAITRNPRETTPGFCPKWEKKVLVDVEMMPNADNSSSATTINHSSSTSVSSCFGSQITEFKEEPIVMFKQISDRLMKIATSFGKDKHGQRANLHL